MGLLRNTCPVRVTSLRERVPTSHTVRAFQRAEVSSAGSPRIATAEDRLFYGVMIYEDLTIKLGNNVCRNINVSACSVPGSPTRPNEDAYAVHVLDGVGVFGVFDGTTSLKPIVELQAKGITGASFASQFVRDYILSLTGLPPLPDLLVEINNALLQEALQFKGASLVDTHTLPATMATLCVIDPDNNTVQVVHTGDSYLIVYYQDGLSRTITPDTNRPFDEGMYTLIEKIARDRGITNREARHTPEVDRALIEMFQYRNNRPDGKGSGLINGDPNVERYLFTQTIPLSDLRQILIGSDGLCPPGWDITNPKIHQQIHTIITTGGLQSLIDIKHAVENSDPDWNYTRYKHSDDATGIWLDLS